MNRSTLAQTFLLCCLPLFIKGFNSSLSFTAEAVGGKVNQVAALTEASYRIKTIVIDPGHGGKDPGCSGAHSREKHIALSVGLQLAEAIRMRFPDVEVILTREKDVFIPLHQRAAIANRANADLFISIHCNFLPGSAATRGTETYVMGLHTAEHNLSVAKRENAAILLEENYEQHYDYDPNSPEGHIMLSMFQNAYLEQSILLAERFEAYAASVANRRSRGVKQAGFVVLKETTMPSILVETGFLSNSREEAFLMSKSGQGDIVRALLLAFADYKQIIENDSFSAYSPEQVVARTPLDGRSDRVPNGHTPLVPATALPSETGTVRKSPDQVPPATSQDTRIMRSPYAQGTEVTPGRTVPARSSATPAASYPTTHRIEDQSELLFCVQLAASPKPLDTRQSKWAELNHRVEVIREDQLFKYQIRHCSNAAEADRVRASVRHLGFMDAFIVVYRNGERLSPREIQLLLEK